MANGEKEKQGTRRLHDEVPLDDRHARTSFEQQIPFLEIASEIASGCFPRIQRAPDIVHVVAQSYSANSDPFLAVGNAAIGHLQYQSVAENNYVTDNIRENCLGAAAMTENVIRNGGDSGVSDGDDNDKQQRRRRRVGNERRVHVPMLLFWLLRQRRRLGTKLPWGAPNFGLSLVVQRTIMVVGVR